MGAWPWLSLVWQCPYGLVAEAFYPTAFPTLLSGGSGWCLPISAALSVVIQWWLKNPNGSGSSVSKFTWSAMLYFNGKDEWVKFEGWNSPCFVIANWRAQSQPTNSKVIPLRWTSGLEEHSSRGRIILKSNRQLVNYTFHYQLHKNKVWLYISIFACSCER